jgi:hypothetical protein
MSENQRNFVVGDWIRAKSGPEKGKTTTITFINDYGYYGYYCGKEICIAFKDAEEY